MLGDRDKSQSAGPTLVATPPQLFAQYKPPWSIAECFIFENRILDHGSTFEMDCNTCNCYAGEITCTKKHCESIAANALSRYRHTGLPCNCAPHHVPVCGTNGNTYPNSCLAKYVFYYIFFFSFKIRWSAVSELRYHMYCIIMYSYFMRIFCTQVRRTVGHRSQVRTVLERRSLRRQPCLSIGRKMCACPSGVPVHVEKIVRPIQVR